MRRSHGRSIPTTEQRHSRRVSMNDDIPLMGACNRERAARRGSRHLDASERVARPHRRCISAHETADGPNELTRDGGSVCLCASRLGPRSAVGSHRSSVAVWSWQGAWASARSTGLEAPCGEGLGLGSTEYELHGVDGSSERGLHVPPLHGTANGGRLPNRPKEGMGGRWNFGTCPTCVLCGEGVVTW